MLYEFSYKGFIVQVTEGRETVIEAINETLSIKRDYADGLYVSRRKGIYALPPLFIPKEKIIVVKETSEAPWSGGIAENH